MKTKTVVILIIIVVAAAAIGVGYYSSRDKEISYDFVEVKRGTVLHKISATGQVMPAKTIDLQFELQGRIESIKTETGEMVDKGEVLALLESRDLESQVWEQISVRDVAQATLDKISAGASQEDIRVYQAQLENARTTLLNKEVGLKNAGQKLEDAQDKAENDLSQAYEDALDELNSIYTTAHTSLIIYDDIAERYFYFTEGISVQVAEKGDGAQLVLARAKGYIDKANNDFASESINSALIQLKSALEKIRECLSFMRQAMDDPVYKNVVSSADETSVDAERSSIDAVVSSLITAEQAVASQKITNQININTAQSNVDLAQAELNTATAGVKTARENLVKIEAPARQEDIALYEAQLRQAQTTLDKARRQLAKARLTAPCQGVVSAVRKEEGEQALAAVGALVISMLCDGKLQIETDIPEVDIGRIERGAKVEIILDAFPEKIFWGELLKIDPAQTLIQGVVYYKATIVWDETGEELYSAETSEAGGAESLLNRVKPGMTANVDIIADKRENVLYVPSAAILSENGQNAVRILQDGEMKEIPIETGLWGSDGAVEIMSGLKQGDKVITFVKSD